MIRLMAVAALLLATLLAGLGAEGTWSTRAGDGRFPVWIGAGLGTLSLAAVLSKGETAAMRWLGRLFFVFFVLLGVLFLQGHVGLWGHLDAEAQRRAPATDHVAILIPKLSGKFEVDAALLTMPPADRDRAFDFIEADALGAQYRYDTAAARKAGFSDKEIIREIARKVAADGQDRPAAR